MAKVAIKNENITSFGGIYYIIREFGIKKALKKLVTSLVICTFIGDNQEVTNKVKAMITKDKVFHFVQ